MNHRLFSLFITGIICLLLANNQTSSASVPVVERLSLTRRSDGKGFVVRIHTTEKVKAYSQPRITGINQFEVTLFETTLLDSYQAALIGGPIQNVHVKSWDNNLTISFTLSSTLAVEIYRDRSTSHLLLGLTYVENASPNALIVEANQNKVAAGPSQHARERWLIDTIVIDAGHGGKDPGAIGYRGLKEKDIALGVALKLGSYLKDNLNVNVVYTREDDHFEELKRRGQIANEAEGKLFVSLHLNSVKHAPQVKGTEIYFLGMHKTKAAKNVMERENSVVELEGNPDDYTGYDEQALILQALTQSAYMRESEILSGLIESQFSDRVGRKSRGVKQAGFYVLWGASMPALLVELGFITNPKEARFLNSNKGQDYMASAIYRAIREFKEHYERDLKLTVAK